MNISEALKLLQDGKKIYHEIMPYVIYQLIDDELKMYRKYDDYEHFVLVDIDNIIKINCKTMLNGWYESIHPVPISFHIAMEFYKAGKQIRRIGEKEWFSKYDLYPMAVTVEDIEAHDWEVVEYE
jgi:hypothetical protein